MPKHETKNTEIKRITFNPANAEQVMRSIVAFRQRLGLDNSIEDIPVDEVVEEAQPIKDTIIVDDRLPFNSIMNQYGRVDNIGGFSNIARRNRVRRTDDGGRINQ